MDAMEKKLSNIFDCLKNIWKHGGNQKRVDTIMVLEKTTKLCATDLSYKYYKNMISDTAAKEQFLELLHNENILDELNAELSCAEQLLVSPEITDKKIRKRVSDYLDKCHLNSLDVTEVSTFYNKCELCGQSMDVNLDIGEMACPSCGCVVALVGTVIYDNSMYYQNESYKSKSGVFNPNRHFMYWWIRIMAQESETELGEDNGVKLIDQLRAIIKRDRKLVKMLTINDIRKMLKEIKGGSDYNKNIPLLMKKLSGIQPPQLNNDVFITSESMFTKIIDISEKTKNEKRVNRNYYPYYIYKILDIILPPDDIESRRIMCYIHIQSETTIAESDKQFQLICKELELPFRITDRNMAYDKYWKI